MIYFSTLIQTNPAYAPASERLFATLTEHGVDFSPRYMAAGLHAGADEVRQICVLP